MLLDYLKYFFIMLLLVSIIGYILVVFKEKMTLMDNTIIINKKSVTQEHIDEADLKVFVIDGITLKSGDEIRVFLSKNIKIEGILIGAKLKDKEIVVVTHDDEVKKLKMDLVRKIKVVSKYGKFYK